VEEESPAIRKALASDGPEIARVVKTSRLDALPYLPVLHDENDDRSYFTGLVQTATAWLAEADGEVVAVLVLDERMVEQLYVAPAWQGRGFGSRLLEVAKANSPDGLRLHTFQRNQRARAFYERRGFVPIEFGDGSSNEEREPDVLYEWNGQSGNSAGDTGQ
jgi:GNAT superfamily N-acetyltransferase